MDLNWSDLLAAAALVLIIEGLLPAINPEAWRESMSRVVQMEPESLRKVGMVSMVIGAALLYWIRG